MRNAMRSRANEEVIEVLVVFCFGSDDLKNSNKDVHFHGKNIVKSKFYLIVQVSDKVEFEDLFPCRLTVSLLPISIISYLYSRKSQSNH